MKNKDIQILNGIINILEGYTNSPTEQDLILLKGIARIFNDNIERWITVKGNHIPILMGQTKKEAIEKFLSGKITTIQKDEPFILSKESGQPRNWGSANGGNVNPFFYKGREYRYNCQSCVAVFEARLRGFNIEALPYDKSNDRMIKLGLHPELAYIDKKTGQHPSFIYSNAKNETECLEFLTKSIKFGERYIFGFRKLGENEKHIVIVIKLPNNEIIFYDAQSGKYYDKNMLKRIEYRRIKINGYYNKPPQMLRIDDKDLDTKYIKAVSKTN